MSEPDQIEWDEVFVANLRDDHPGHPFEGNWHCDKGAFGGKRFLRETPARLHADELAEALREAVDKLQHAKQITGLGFPSFQSRASELLSKLEDGQ